jgi:hypothetical protein
MSVTTIHVPFTCTMADVECAYLVLLFASIGFGSHIVVYVPIEQWTALSASFGDDQIVERVVLCTTTASIHPSIAQ